LKFLLKNIGLIKKADIKLDGLTVIAGENDSGKSTVGKALFALIKSDNICRLGRLDRGKKPKNILAWQLNLVFDGNITSGNGKIILKDKSSEVSFAEIKDKNSITRFNPSDTDKSFFDATFINSPLVFDLIDFFNSVSKMKEREVFNYGAKFNRFNIKYPYIMWDLYDKLTKENPYPYTKIQKKVQESISDIIKGEFIVDRGKIFYNKAIDSKILKIEMFNTAMGIKSFGIIQLLNNSRYLDRKYLLIFDEPEVHLHPKWQLEMAKLLVNLVKIGVKIVVNSHSPYMIEALKRYSDLENLEEITNFYLAENGEIKQIEDNNSKTLVEIYERLSEPYDEFEKMESERFLNG